MHVLDLLGDPVRRRLVELLGDGDGFAGDLAAAIGAEFGVSQPAVSNQLRILREAGVVASTPEGSRRRYSLRPERIAEVDEWVARRRMLWSSHLGELAAAAGEPS